MALPASAQNLTTASATVVDSAGTAYTFGTYTVNLVNNSGQPALLGGNTNFQKTYQGGLDTNGLFSLVLPSVSVMTPGGMQWSFYICANPQVIAYLFPKPALPCFTYTSTGTQISGSSVDLSASMSAVAAPIPKTVTTPLPNLGSFCIVDGTTHLTIQSCHDSFTAVGGTILVMRAASATAIGAAGFAITKPVHVIFDVGNFSPTVTLTAAQVISCVNTDSVIIEGAGQRGGSNIGNSGTAIGPNANTTANGMDFNYCPGAVIKNLELSGTASGTGRGIILTGPNSEIDNVIVSSWGGDGITINGTRNFSNLVVLHNVRAQNNKGNGFVCFGTNGNLVKWEGTSASANTGYGYALGGASSPSCADNVFVGTHSEGSIIGTGFHFLTGSTGNQGSIYSEPAAPETQVALFDSGAKYSNLQVLNGSNTPITDSDGTNGWSLNTSSGGLPGNSYHWYQNTETNTSGVLNPIRKVQRNDAASEQLVEGIFFKTADVTSGYTLKENGSLNFIYNNNATTYGLNTYNNCTAADITGCTKVWGSTSSLFAGTAPATGAASGDFSSSRSATSGAHYFGTDGNTYLFRPSGTVLTFGGSAFTPAAAAGGDFGSASLPGANLWIGTAATNNFKFQPATAAAARTIVIPDFGVSTGTMTFKEFAQTFTATQTFSAGSGNADIKVNNAMVAGNAPTCSSTGSTSPTCTVTTGSTNTAGTIQITVGTSPAALGTVTLTFSGNFGTNPPVCIMQPSQLAVGQWNARATIFDKTPAIGSDLQNWDNNGTVLTASTAIDINYHCWAK